MRYSDSELFSHPDAVLNGLKNKMIFSQFCKWAEFRLNSLVIESTKSKLWLSHDINHLRNYRVKAADFYRKRKENRIMSQSLSKIKREFEDDYKVMDSVLPSVYEQQIRGDGGFTNYYAVPEGATQLSDLIYHKNMNHSIGEAFCALYRMNDNGEKVRNIKKVIRYMELELEKEQPK